MQRRAQKVVVIQRKSDGLFYAAPPKSSSPDWVEDIALANFVSPMKVKSLIRAVWGRDEVDFRVVEVVPTVATI